MLRPGAGLIDPYLKIRWAEGHLKTLDVKLAAFQGSTDANTITGKDDFKNQRYVIRVQLGDIPDPIPLIVGDAVYSMRASLDQIIWSLACKTAIIPEKTQFPILSVPPDAVTKEGKRSAYALKQNLRGVPDEAREVVKLLQPYQRKRPYESQLWRLNAICNLDKHRRIAANGSELIVRFPAFPTRLGHLIEKEAFNDYSIFSVPISLKANLLQLNPTVSFKVNFGGDAYWEKGIVGGKILYHPSYSRDELWDIYQFVSETVFPRLARFLM